MVQFGRAVRLGWGTTFDPSTVGLAGLRDPIQLLLDAIDRVVAAFGLMARRSQSRSRSGRSGLRRWRGRRRLLLLGLIALFNGLLVVRVQGAAG